MKEASLYIDSVIRKTGFTRHGEGYFRDTYSNDSLFLRLGLSWIKDVSPRLTDNYLLPVNACNELMGLLLVSQIMVRGLKPEHEEARQKLIDLLRLAIDLNEPVFCDL